MRVGVDIMGGDYVPHAPIEGAILAQNTLGDDIQIVLIGDRETIVKELQKNGLGSDAFEIIHAEEVISMSANPVRAIAQFPKSSINIGIQLLRSGKLDGFVGAGNTGAMLVGSILGLGKVEGVARPTIGTLFPNATGGVTLLCDVGANVDCKAETLYHFAILGSLYTEHVLKVPNPRVALMNIGEEESKGPQVVQNAFKLMKDSSILNFVGNAEGRDIYKGTAEVYVCDGFTGNIILKFGESLYDIFKSRLPGDQLMESFNFENYGGVPILGINGIVIIGHGISTPKAISNMIRQAASSSRSDLTNKVRKAFEELDL